MKNSNRWILSIIACLGVLNTGCVYYPTEQSRTIIEKNGREADKTWLANCQLLGQVYGDSALAYTAVGVEISKDRAKNRAAKLGATHIVWSEVNQRGIPFVLGRAYQCNMPMKTQEG